MLLFNTFGEQHFYLLQKQHISAIRKQLMNPYFEFKRSIYVPKFKHVLKLNWAVFRRTIMKNSISSLKHMWFELYLKQMNSSVAFQNVLAAGFLYAC